MFQWERKLWQIVLFVSLSGTAAHAVPSWSLQSTSGPSPRAEHAMVYDSCRNVVVLQGGADAQGGFADTWEWDGNEWSLRATTGPGPRGQASMAFDAARCVSVLFGGGFWNDGYLNDTWEWDGNAWTEKCTNCGPTARTTAAMAYYASRQRVVLFGGWSSSEYLNDVWAWDGATWAPVTTNSGPTPRGGARMVYDTVQDRLVVFGGRLVPVTCGTMTDETWELEWPVVSGAATWTLSGSSLAPSQRELTGMAFDASSGSTLLFGGMNTCDDFYGDTWRYDGTSWHLVTDSGGPSRRHQFGMVFDEARGETVLFGGVTNLAYGQVPNESSGETWSYGEPPPPVPTVSEWGLIAMTVLGLTVGSILFSRARRTQGI